MRLEKLVGTISNGWEYTTLGEVCILGGGSIQTGPFGSQLHAADYVSVGVPLIMPRNIGDNRINEEGIARITVGDAKRLGRYLVEAGDIIYSRRGDVERRALIRINEDGWLCGTGCLRVRLGKQGPDPQYTAYYLGHPQVRKWIVRHAHGATMPNLNTAILSACPFLLPPISQQRVIAHILGALDDKIELNRQMNKTLEAMARALYKSWFVDFDGVSPEDMQESELGLIPKGWRVSTIGEEVIMSGGATPSTKEPEYWEGGLHCWATPKDLSLLTFPVLLTTKRKITDAGLMKIASGLLPIGTLLLSSRAPIGYMAITEVPTAINQGFIAMQCEGALPNLFVLHWCRENMETIVSNANGSTFLEISKRNFRPLPVIVPSAEVLCAFERLVRPLHQRIVGNEQESQTLANLRDILLPKLISGELRVDDKFFTKESHA